MYTQNYKAKQNETNIVTFPNRESIMQMKSLSDKSNTPETNTCQNVNARGITSFCTTDDLLLLGALLSISEDDRTNSILLTLISGVLVIL